MLKNLVKIKFQTIVRHLSKPVCKQSPLRVSASLAFGKYLLVTNIISSGILMLIGDGIQQEIEYHQNKRKQRYDYKRLSTFIMKIY